MQNVTLQEWRDEAARRFGPDPMQWRFVCPSCGHVAAVKDWKDAGATEAAVAVCCVGRALGTSTEIGQKPGPCNYAGYGLFRLNPVKVVFEDGKTLDVFDFAGPDVEPAQ